MRDRKRIKGRRLVGGRANNAIVIVVSAVRVMVEWDDYGKKQDYVESEYQT